MTYSDVIGTIGVGVTLVGFVVTIWQLWRTANASEASVKAIERTEKRMALNHLLVLLPQFQLFETQLDAAAEANNRDMAIHSLNSYRVVASELAVMLGDQDGVQAELVDKLRVSAREASLAKSDLISNRDATVMKLTEGVRAELGELGTSIAEIGGRFKIQTGVT